MAIAKCPVSKLVQTNSSHAPEITVYDADFEDFHFPKSSLTSSLAWPQRIPCNNFSLWFEDESFQRRGQCRESDTFISCAKMISYLIFWFMFTKKLISWKFQVVFLSAGLYHCLHTDFPIHFLTPILCVKSWIFNNRFRNVIFLDFSNY